MAYIMRINEISGDYVVCVVLFSFILWYSGKGNSKVLYSQKDSLSI